MCCRDLLVVFRHEGDEFILQKEDIKLNRYHREMPNQSVVDFVSKENHYHVGLFFEFLQIGEIPTNFEDQIRIFQILKEWDGNCSLLDSFQNCIEELPLDGYVLHLNNMYQIKLGCLYIISPVFQEFCHKNPKEIFAFDPIYSPEAIECFLNFVNNRVVQYELCEINELLSLCEYLGCSSQCSFLIKRFAE